jgi:hypothetical protein
LDDDFWKLYGGGVLSFAGFSVAGGYGKQDEFGIERKWFNAGAAASLGPVTLSVTGGKVLDADDGIETKGVVLSGTVGILPGVTLDGDLLFFDKAGDRRVTRPNPIPPPNTITRRIILDDGVVGLVRLAVAF